MHTATSITAKRKKVFMVSSLYGSGWVPCNGEHHPFLYRCQQVLSILMQLFFGILMRLTCYYIYMWASFRCSVMMNVAKTLPWYYCFVVNKLVWMQSTNVHWCVLNETVDTLPSHLLQHIFVFSVLSSKW